MIYPEKTDRYNIDVFNNNFKEIIEKIGVKVDKSDGMGLSSNDYTTAEKEKLSQLVNYDDTDLQNRLNKIEDYSYAYSGSSADKKNYYYCISESTITGSSNFESIQTVLALRPVAVLNANSARFGIIQVQGRYDQNGDGTDDNTFTVVNVNWVLSSNIQTDKFIVAYNNAEKKIRLYYKANSTYDGFVAQKVISDIASPSALANPTVLIKDTTGIATLPEGWIVSGSGVSLTAEE